MAKLRLEITKGEEIRYISHLDYASAAERAILRAQLPAAYSEGFNPHMKLSFASALAVGVTSRAEYMDVELKETVDLMTAVKQLSAALPPGMHVNTGKYAAANAPALMAVVNLAEYEIAVPLLPGTDAAEAAAGVAAFNRETVIMYTRVTPKGRKEIDVKEYTAQPVRCEYKAGGLLLHMAVHIKPGGSIKPGEILTVLSEQFGVAVDTEAALIERTGLYVVKNGRRLTPLEA